MPTLPLSVRVAAWAVEVLAGKDLFRQGQMGEGELHEQIKVVGLALLGSQLAYTKWVPAVPRESAAPTGTFSLGD